MLDDLGCGEVCNLVGFASDIGVDLGTSNSAIFCRDKGVSFFEPTVLALYSESGQVVGIGGDAVNAASLDPGNICMFHPVRRGCVADCELTAAYLSRAFNKVGAKRLGTRPKVTATMPCIITGLQKRALTQALYEAGAAKVDLVPSVVSTAYGLGLDPYTPDGNLIIDIGGGCTDIALVAMGEVVYSETLDISGSTFDDAVRDYVRAANGLVIGESLAEQIKNYACGPNLSDDSPIWVKGIKVTDGLPLAVTLKAGEIREAIASQYEILSMTTRHVLEQAGPELCSDILGKGALLTGGCSSVPGLPSRLTEDIGLPVLVSDNPFKATVEGFQHLLSNSASPLRQFAQRLRTAKTAKRVAT
jgi:rod shape-determining protein MreB